MLKNYAALPGNLCKGFVMLSTLLMTPVFAQQEGQGYGGSAGQGGTTSPHGSEGGGGAFGGGTNEGRLEGGGRSGFGYWGGRHVPAGPGGVVPAGPGVVVPGAETESGGASSFGYGAEGTLAGSCDDLAAEAVKAGNRLKGRNLVRINIAGIYLASDVTVEKIERSGSPRRNLANFQEVLEKETIDTLVAGIYLGLVSMIEVTPEVVNKVNAILCVKSSPQQSAAIAKVAEEQRQSISTKK